MRSVLASYDNGNYHVTLYDDGTKVRKTLDPKSTEFIPERAETVDLSITDYCDVGCPFCYMNCTQDGRHADLGHPFLDTIPVGTEVAIGGGSPILHPDLDKLLLSFRNRGIVPSITVHHSQFANEFLRIRELSEWEMLFGVGVSMPACLPSVLKKMVKVRHVVSHVIAGIIPANEVLRISDYGLPILVLGYKNKGRAFHETLPNEVGDSISSLRDLLPKLFERKCTVCFDNLAIEQLGVKDLVSNREWERGFLGDDGLSGSFNSASMYVDLVHEKFAMNSTTATQYDFSQTGTFQGMFQYLRSKHDKSAQRGV